MWNRDNGPKTGASEDIEHLVFGRCRTSERSANQKIKERKHIERCNSESGTKTFETRDPKRLHSEKVQRGGSRLKDSVGVRVEDRGRERVYLYELLSPDKDRVKGSNGLLETINMSQIVKVNDQSTPVRVYRDRQR